MNETHAQYTVCVFPLTPASTSSLTHHCLVWADSVLLLTFLQSLENKVRRQGAVQVSSKTLTFVDFLIHCLSLDNGDMSVFLEDRCIHSVVVISCLVTVHDIRHLKMKSETELIMEKILRIYLSQDNSDLQKQ